MISTSEYNTVKVKYNTPFVTVVLNRPEKRNALNGIMIKELTRIFSEINKDKSIKTVTLTGAGKVFCSGADLAYLKELKEFSYEENLKDSLRLSQLFIQIYTLTKPVIAVVKGAAIAGGCGLASVCDFIISEKDALFGYPEVKIGFIAALVSVFLIRQIGERRARQLMLSGEIINAEKAEFFGLITSSVEKDDLWQYENSLREKLVKNSPHAMAETKRILSAFVYKDIKAEVEKLAKYNAKFRETEDFLEGISAFLEKRNPKWSE